ncbi:Gluconolactonase [Beutenbergia cavernae DSM 12333]|uniref:Gluconolactonase n=1 Tax=Beutenbergia cavernae (strain ATCC BAA-8 / DSM 12333 / CCUG 43141 / JCM 11478 / NBRC 16432 / NCIMB 13614 / HKI 0122) TaxID=471853 RepID=C5BVQ6_BEUC1|nr:SMP-30/gluconolactonase/LRE family protein [Beutenbergia cavernae]ACQ78496.1 Gluconolactonase [Beutenbergia cavernae DSM 12333]
MTTSPPLEQGVIRSLPLELDPAVGHEAELAALIAPGTSLDLLADGGIWFEGPAWVSETEIVWSDVVGNRLLTWSPDAGAGILLEPSHHQNGHTLDGEGRLLAASHGERAIVRRELDGAWAVVVDRHDGRRFNSPNDLVVAADGAVWFTDPRYGIDKPEEGYGGEVEMDGCHVYRVAPDGHVRVVARAQPGPNGLAFSPAGDVLYLADSEAGHVLAFPVTTASAVARDPRDGEPHLGAPTTFALIAPGAPDGVRVDSDGRLWVSSGSGVQVYVPGTPGGPGERLGTIRVPEPTANLAFGGPGRSVLAITATSGLYRVATTVRGVGS